ncbi:MAG: restriction endonuclease subunit S [Prolixibacteraceae bacterium]|jgi:type I restriction enzyme S subunit|nr:restriction endonuclease subunit S [Prolixibacteraceae bacterium]
MKDDWIEVELGKALLIERGGSPRPIKEFITDDVNGINWIKIGDTKVNSKYIFRTAEKIRPEGLKKSRHVNEGDLLLSNSMSFGRPYILKTSGAIHDGWLVLKNKTELKIDAEYLYYALSSPIIFAQFDKLATGSTVRNLNKDLVSKVISPIAPLPIQRAIVSKIETLFSDIDKGIADLNLAKDQLKIYRQAVLKKAFEGKMSGTVMKNDEFDKHDEKENHGHQEHHKNHSSDNLPKGWKWKMIKDVCVNVKVGIVIKPTNFYSPDSTGIHAFRSANVREFMVNDSNWVYFTKEGNELNKRTQLKEGDVLIVRSGYPGTSCVVPSRFVGSNAIDILIASPNPSIMTSKYLCAFNNSPLGKGLFSAGSRGVAQKHLNVGVYSKLEISVPPIEIQHQIVREIESRLSVCDKVEQSINEALSTSEALRQSILKKAFEGRLLSEVEVERCKQEKDYEPASVLLEKIKKS